MLDILEFDLIKARMRTRLKCCVYIHQERRREEDRMRDEERRREDERRREGGGVEKNRGGGRGWEEC